MYYKKTALFNAVFFDLDFKNKIKKFERKIKMVLY